MPQCLSPSPFQLASARVYHSWPSEQTFSFVIVLFFPEVWRWCHAKCCCYEPVCFATEPNRIRWSGTVHNKWNCSCSRSWVMWPAIFSHNFSKCLWKQMGFLSVCPLLFILRGLETTQFPHTKTSKMFPCIMLDLTLKHLSRRIPDEILWFRLQCPYETFSRCGSGPKPL